MDNIGCHVSLGARSGGRPSVGAVPVPDFFRYLAARVSFPVFEAAGLGSGSGDQHITFRRGGQSNWSIQLVGDYTNPILKPGAAETVKERGAISLSGSQPYPTLPPIQCWPQDVPYIFWSFGMQMLQEPDRITFIYTDPNNEIRQARLNQAHPAHVIPSFYGDSVGHYEGDALVIDTIGVKTDRPFAMLDMYGTPFTDALHVVERYRLLDYAAAKDGFARDAKENFHTPGPPIDPAYKGKYLQLEFTVEDDGVFSTPWTATITYRPDPSGWVEEVCAENPHEYYSNKDTAVPMADKADF